MEYSNPKIPEHINTTREHPLKEFLLLGGGVLGAITLLILLLSLMAEILAPYVPFSMEEDIASRFIDSPEPDSETYFYLQNLVDGLTPHLDLDPGVKVTLHYVDDEVQNAFATIGGHIFIHRGLLEMLPHENALCMVIAHEIAHVKFRHPLIATGRGLTVLMLLAAVTGFGGDRIAGNIITNVGTLTVLSFSREQESHADRAALAALQGYYGHVSGADELFRILRDKGGDSHSAELEFFSTHPLSSERIEEMSNYARVNNWSKEEVTTPLKHDGS